MATIAGQGTQTCTVTTEHIVYDATTTAGIYQGYFDLINAVKGDIFEIWVEMAVRSGGTDGVVVGGTYANDMEGSTVVVTPPLSNHYGMSFHIRQAAGTSRDVPWRVDQIDG